MKSSFGIAVFHNIGDILLCTPIARQLKADNPDCEVIWFTSEKYKFILEHNPFIDQIVPLDGDPLMLDKSIPALKSGRQWTRFFTPAAYMNYSKAPGGSLPEIVKASVDFEWTVPFVPVLRLSESERVKAAAYWNGLPSGKKILIETEFHSQQSPLTKEYIEKLFEVLSPIDPVFVFTAKNKPEYFDEFQNKYSKVFWCQEGFRLNAEFYNLCDAFVGVSSGISCISNSDYCRNDVPHLEISRGYHWSNASYRSGKKELYVSHSRARYVDGLYWLFNKLTDSAAEHCFSPRFTSDTYVYANKEIVTCPLCGAAGCTAARRNDIVKCNQCGNIYSRMRMNNAAMEKYYSEIYAANRPEVAAYVQVPRSKEEIDLRPEFVSAQRRDVLAEIQSLLKVDLAGKVLIDIGCGWGAFLHHARNQGMKVIGFEFANPNVEFGRNVLNIDIRQEQFIDVDDIQENSVDLIVMNHSLEHVPYPFEFLEKIEYVLKPGGIFFGMVPNFESICSNTLLGKWAWIEPDWHYTHFTPKTLKEALAQTGFYIEKLYTTSGDYGDNIPISILKKIIPGLYEQNYQQHLKEFQKHGRGEQINVIAVKRGSSKGRIQAKDNSFNPGLSNAIRKVLIVRSDSIGDFIIFSGTLKYFKKLYPQARITLVVSDTVTDMAAACPHVDSIMSFNRAKMEQDMQYMTDFVNIIRKEHYDVAIAPALSRDIFSEFIVINSKAAEKITCSGDTANLPLEILRENDKYFTRIIPMVEGIKLETARNEEFIKGLGAELDGPYKPDIWLNEEDIAFADSLLEELHIDKPVIFAPFAQNRKRNWPVINWTKLVSIHADQPIIICGVAGDKAEAEKIINLSGHRNIHNLCGQTTIRQLVAIISKAKVCVTCESATAHIAAVVNIPHVVLLGGGHFGRFMPYSDTACLVYNKMSCFNCNWKCRYGLDTRCIYYISVDAVDKKLCQVLGGSDYSVEIVKQEPCQAFGGSDYLVSAIVSTYNSEKFIRGCLQDLVEQTLYPKGQLEIVVVNSGSQQDEEAIVREFQSRYKNIVYIKTKREGLYSAWNRAVKVASGQFLTNANTDDRHRKDAFEVMANTLLKNTDIALVYGDQIVTDTPNSTFENHQAVEIAKRPEFSRQRLLFGCCVGSQPMWLKSLHDELGGFDETLTCAGDWDFWLRVAGKYGFKHIPESLGLYYRNEQGIEHGQKIHSLYERYAVGRRYGNPYISVIKPYQARGNPLVSVWMAVYNGADYIARAIESVLIQNYCNFELIVVDDGSTDRTADIIHSFKHEAIKYFLKEHGGLASARNVQLQKSSGSFIVSIDSDDMVTPDFLSRHLEVFERHPEADLVYCDDYLIDEKDKPIRVIDRPEYSDSQKLISDLFRCGFPIVPFRTCIRKNVFDKIGLYDERLIVAEDYDMMRRFVNHGFRIQHLPGAFYLRRVNTSSHSRNFNAAKAKSQFEAIRRFTETFTPEQLFPDVQWDKMPAEQKPLLVKCKAALVYIGIGEQYLVSNAQDYAEAAFEMACAQLDDCCKIEPANHQVRNLREKCQFIRAKNLSSGRLGVCQPA
jgi:glycosyltransferase involved in cell wall biosynthesis/ADP-heptose:LPS heptosyltransferase/2-polyprenyl-3-methyl-5-hydroxy-6-metoxy-1,4-benzoquinol methylase